MPFFQSGMVAMYGLPIICPPYDLHVKPHLIPLVLPLSQVLMNQHLRNNNNKLKNKKLLLWTITKLRLGFVPLTSTLRFPWIVFFALFTNFLFISLCFYSIPKLHAKAWIIYWHLYKYLGWVKGLSKTVKEGLKVERKENFFLSVTSTPLDGRIVPFTDVDILCTLRHPCCQKIIQNTFHFHQKSIGKLRHFKKLIPKKLKSLGSIKWPPPQIQGLQWAHL